MAHYARRPRAADDLVDIWTHIARDNPAAADRLLDRIDQKCSTLAEYPFMGRERPDIDPSIYSFPIDNYIIYYRHAGDGIEIIRVLHAARDVYAAF